jgi:hypothetical protein
MSNNIQLWPKQQLIVLNIMKNGSTWHLDIAVACEGSTTYWFMHDMPQ